MNILSPWPTSSWSLAGGSVCFVLFCFCSLCFRVVSLCVLGFVFPVPCVLSSPCLSCLFSLRLVPRLGCRAPLCAKMRGCRAPVTSCFHVLCFQFGFPSSRCNYYTCVPSCSWCCPVSVSVPRLSHSLPTVWLSVISCPCLLPVPRTLGSVSCHSFPRQKLNYTIQRDFFVW